MKPDERRLLLAIGDALDQLLESRLDALERPSRDFEDTMEAQQALRSALQPFDADPPIQCAAWLQLAPDPCSDPSCPIPGHPAIDPSAASSLSPPMEDDQ